MSRSIVVAGGGLAGLVAARHLADAGADVTVYEARETVGGRVRSRRHRGFTLDRGFQVLFTAYPAVQRELDLAALDLQAFNPGAVIARPGQRSVLSDPLRDPRAAFESLINDEVGFSDKLRTLALRSDLAGREYDTLFERPDASIREYLREWGFSERFLANFIAPFYGGITLDRGLETSKRVFEYTFKALSDGRSAVPADGMGAIARQLAEHATDAGASIETGEGVTELNSKRRHAVVVTDGDRRAVDAVVVATGPRAAARLTGVESIPTAGIGCVTQHYRLPGGTPLDTGRRLLLNAGGTAPNTVVPISETAPSYADSDVDGNDIDSDADGNDIDSDVENDADRNADSDGNADGDLLLNATFLGEAALETASDELARQTREALTAWYPERRFERLETLETDRIPFAQFAQPPGVHESLPDVRDGGPRTYLAGDFTEWSSIQGAMESGREAADAVLEDF